jgi:hypothetical protein
LAGQSPGGSVPIQNDVRCAWRRGFAKQAVRSFATVVHLGAWLRPCFDLDQRAAATITGERR